jgi:membrane fusion protein, adhesin transport system
MSHPAENSMVKLPVDAAEVIERAAKPAVPYQPKAITPRQEDAEFIRTGYAAAMERPRRFTHWILLATILFFAVAIAWANWATLDEVTVGEGKVIPSSQVQVVQNLEGGIVSEILVKEGDTVQKDQALMRIDDKRFNASYKEGQAKDEAQLGKIARLNAEANGTAFIAPAALLASHPTLVAEEKALFESRKQSLQANLTILQQQVEQRKQESTEKRARLEQLRQSFSLANKELQLMRPMAQQGVVSEVELLKLERGVNDLKGDMDATQLALPRLESAQQEILNKINELYTRFKAEAMKELNQARADQTAISAANTANEDRVVRTLVKAPLAGVVKQIKVNTVGGVVQPGMDLMEIVPADDWLLVEAKVRPADIAFLHPGQAAMVKLSAYDFSIYGGFPAKLEHISADSIAPEKPGEKNESYYRIRLRTTQNKFSGRGEALPILPGMVATVDIQTGKKTVLEYLLKPIIKTKQTAMREK